MESMKTLASVRFLPHLGHFLVASLRMRYDSVLQLLRVRHILISLDLFD